jgi:hypothetical protein
MTSGLSSEATGSDGTGITSGFVNSVWETGGAAASTTGSGAGSRSIVATGVAVASSEALTTGSTAASTGFLRDRDARALAAGLSASSTVVSVISCDSDKRVPPTIN